MTNGLLALRAIGIDAALKAWGVPIRRFETRSDRDRLIFSAPLFELGHALGAPSICLPRWELQCALRSEVPPEAIRMDSTCTGFEADGNLVRVRLQDGRVEEGELLIGADGFHSAIRAQLAGPTAARPAGYVAWLGTARLVHERFVEGCVYHFWGRGRRFGVVDIGGGRVYWWGTSNRTPEPSGTGARAEVQESFRGWPDLVQECIDVTHDDRILRVNTQDRRPLRRWSEHRVTLLGDAAHPMLTSLGQGAAIAMEDAAVLARCLAAETRPEVALRTYEARRRPRANGLVRLARFVSGYEQLENGVACRIRDGVFRRLPSWTIRRQLEPLLRFTA